MEKNRLLKSDRWKMFLVRMIVLVGFSAVVMLLWNLLIPAIFGLKVITFWQAAGLFILSRILFSSFWGGGNHHHHRMNGFHGDNLMHEKWMKMSEEERIEFINKKRKFFHGAPFDRRDFFGHEHERTESDEESGNDRK
jgi:hypothetical protein